MKVRFQFLLHVLLLGFNEPKFYTSKFETDYEALYSRFVYILQLSYFVSRKNQQNKYMHTAEDLS